jgi:6-phospho-beta-glucosidase
MKVILIGGSSPSTPALIQNLRKRSDLPPLEVVLLGQSKSRLTEVLRAARLLAAGTDIQISSALLSDPSWAHTFLNADMIILQARPGGYEARRSDEKLPLKYGICGDQDLGPGGIANAWRSWPHLKQFFVQAQLRAPRALFVILSSPVGLLVHLGLMSAPRLKIAGICELPWTTIQEVCEQAGAFEQGVEFGYLGLHHLGWIYRLRFGERDLVTEYAKRAYCRSGFPSESLIQKYSAIPTKYVRMHFEQAEVVSEQERRSESRSEFLEKYRDQALAVFECGAVAEIESILTKRPTPWYSKAIAPLIAATGGSNLKEPLFLSRVHGALLPELNADEVFEAACDVHGKEITPRPLPGPIPGELTVIIRRFMRAEQVAAEAIWQRNLDGLVQALDMHPWTCSMHEANRSLAREIRSVAPRDGVYDSST